MPGLTAARLTAVVDSDTSKAESGLDRVGSKIEQTGKRGSALMGIGTAMTAGITIPVVGAGIAAARLAMDFEQTMDVLRATVPASQATDANMKAMSATARALGADITLPGVSAKDAGVAMLELSRAGLSVKDSMGGAKGSLMLAAAGQLDVGHAAEITGAALQVFNMRGSESGKVADMLAAGANASSASVESLAMGLSQSGSAFAGAHMSMNDLVTSMSLMANAGIKGSDAGTSLKTMLSSLQAPTGKAADLMEELNIATRDQAGRMLPMPALIGNFNKALKGKSDAEKDAALKTIFGSDAIRAARTVILGGADAYATMSAKIAQQGAAQKLAASYNKGAKGALDALKSTVETAAIELATHMLPAIKSVALGLAGLITWVKNLPAPILAFVGTLIGVAAAAGPILIVVGAFMKLRAAIALLNLAPLIAGFGVFAIIAAVVVAFVVAYKTNFLGLRDITLKVVAAIKGAWDSFVAGFQGGSIAAAMGQTTSIFERLGSAVRTVITTVKTAWGAFVAGFTGGPLTGTLSGLQVAMQSFGTIVRTVFNAVLSVWRTVIGFVLAEGSKWLAWFQTMAPIVSAAFSNIATVVKVYLGIVVAVIRSVLSVVMAIWRAVWPGLLTVLRGVWTIISGVVSGSMQVIRGIIQVVMSLIAGNWGAAWDGIKSMFSGVGKILTSIGRGFLQILWGLVKTYLGLLKAFWSTIWNGIKAFFSAWGRWLASAAKAIWNGLTNTIRTALNAARTVVTTIWNAIRSFITGAVNKIRSVVSSVFNAVRSLVSSVMSSIRSTVTSAWNTIRSAVTSAVNSVRSAVSSAFNSARSAVSSAMSSIRSAVSSAFNSVVSTVSSAMSRLGSAISSGVSRAVGFVRSMGSQLVSAVSSAGGRLFSAGAEIIGRLVSGISSRIQGAVDAVRGAVRRITDLLPGSPVKTGPLRVLNNGYAGGQISKMLADGITGKQSAISAAMRTAASIVARQPIVGTATLNGPRRTSPTNGGIATRRDRVVDLPGTRNTGVNGGIDYDKLARAIARVQISLDGRQVARSVDERLGTVLR